VINREDAMVYQGHDRDTVIDWVPAQGQHALLELMIMLDDGSNTTLGTQRSEAVRHSDNWYRGIANSR
jgi:hypothetical protein